MTFTRANRRFPSATGLIDAGDFDELGGSVVPINEIITDLGEVSQVVGGHPLLDVE